MQTNVNAEGQLTIGGLGVIGLTQTYGTPLYIMDEAQIRENLRAYRGAMAQHFPNGFEVAYASKAFCTSYMYHILKEEGICADVVSGGELYTALHAGFDAAKLYFHGNNKTTKELTMALEAGVGRIVVDNIYELHLLDDLAKAMGKKPKIMFRIKPGIDAHTHDFIMTGQIDSKFGVALENGEAYAIIKETKSLSNVELVGIHCHIGSQIFDNEPFMLAAKVMLSFAKKIGDELGVSLNELNLGGGFGIMYTEKDDPKSPAQNIAATAKALREIAAELGVAVPKIIIEPGRAIVAPAGITAYTIGGIKEIKNVRNYISIDGGMTDNPRYALYESEYDFVLAHQPMAEKTYPCAIAGRCCESGDMLAKNTKIPPAKVGDILCTLATGAYNYSMASHYNRVCKPAVVMVKDGQAKLVVKREEYADLVRNDIL